MPPHHPWRPAATERRLSLVRRSSSLLVRRSARSYLSLPGMVGKSSRSKRFSGHQAWKLLVSQQVRRGPSLLRVRKESEVAWLFFRRLEHSCGNPRDEAARNQAFAVCAQIISKPGNHVAFSSRERLQPGACYFFRGLGLSNEFLLSSHDMKFRLRRAWAERANANSVRPHLLSKSFREEQVKSFRGRVS